MARTRAIAVVVGSLLGALSPAAEAKQASDDGWPLAPLSREEQSALATRELVKRPLSFARGADGSYVGGVSYQVVRAEPRQVLLTLADVEALQRVLPATQSATMVSREGRTARVELVQGKAPFWARYTVVLEQSDDGSTIRYWLDPTRPHDIKDVWGFFRVESFGPGKSLVTVAAALDLGPGITRALFEERVQRVILRTPSRIRSFVESLALGSTR
jgi:carbon monoxide dehydrogenase subunit G